MADPQMAFAFCYIASHFGLGLLTDEEATGILEYVEDELGEEIGTGEGRSFWQSVSLEELAEEQGVEPVSAPEEVFALWPVDDDPDALLNFVLHDRGSRRKAVCRRECLMDAVLLDTTVVSLLHPKKKATRFAPGMRRT